MELIGGAQVLRVGPLRLVAADRNSGVPGGCNLRGCSRSLQCQYPACAGSTSFCGPSTGGQNCDWSLEGLGSCRLSELARPSYIQRHQQADPLLDPLRLLERYSHAAFLLQALQGPSRSDESGGNSKSDR